MKFLSQMSTEMKKKINYEWYFEIWNKFFLSKGLEKIYSENLQDDFYSSFKGEINRSSELKIDLYAGDYRTDTNTHGCIGVDFVKNYNKLSQMPIYVDLDIDEEKLWEAILLLVKHEEEFPEKYSSIKLSEKGRWKLIKWEDEE